MRISTLTIAQKELLDFKFKLVVLLKGNRVRSLRLVALLEQVLNVGFFKEKPWEGLEPSTHSSFGTLTRLLLYQTELPGLAFCFAKTPF